MRLSYRQLEDLLADLHDIAPSSRVALQGRIKHFQRNGWPGGTNTGKGRAATYDFGAVIKICLGFEMLQLGVTPERSAIILRDNWSYVRTAISLAVNAHPSLSAIGVTSFSDQGFDVFLYCDPKALAQLSDSKIDPSEDTFFYTSAPELGRRLIEGKKLDVQRLALINLTIVLDSIAHSLPNLDALRSAYLDWDQAERAAEDEDARSAIAN